MIESRGLYTSLLSFVSRAFPSQTSTALAFSGRVSSAISSEHHPLLQSHTSCFTSVTTEVMASQSQSQQSELMLNVSQQNDESNSPRMAYCDGESMSGSSSAGSRADDTRIPDNILVYATQDDTGAGNAPLGPQGEAFSFERVEDSFEPPHVVRADKREIQLVGTPASEHVVDPLNARMDHSDKDDEELYCVSPAGEAKHTAAVSAGKQAKIQVISRMQN